MNDFRSIAAASQPEPQRTKRTEFERIALLLQGGGALGAYQAGVYQALAEENLHPDWVAGISIGAINSAIIAGNPPEKRVERLRDFWETVSQSPLGIPYIRTVELKNDFLHQFINQVRAFNILMFGAPNFFTPRVPPATMWPTRDPSKASYYDNTPLRTTLDRLVDRLPMRHRRRTRRVAPRRRHRSGPAPVTPRRGTLDTPTRRSAR